MRVKLGDVCTVISGSTPKTGNTEFWDGDIDWITPAELTDESFIVHESVRKITQAAVVKTGLRSFPAGTVILSSRAPIGKVAIAGKEMYCNQGFKNLICGSMIHHEYLYWFLKGKTEYLNSLGRGATFKEISKSIVEKVEIPLPAMPEQMKCAATFKAIWGIINLRKQQLAELDNLVKCRFVEMFGDSQCSYSQIQSIAEDVFAGGDKPKDTIKTKDTSHPYPVFANGELNQGLQGYSRLCRVDKKAITVSARGTIGYCCIRDAGFTPIVRLITLIPKPNINLTYLSEAIKFIGVGASGAVQAQLTVPDFKKIKIPLPSINSQITFASFVRRIDKFKFVVQQSLDETQKLFDSFMQEYFDSW